jgi:uncharacterized protein YutE (UPF0331/DUF86 family)
MSDEVLHRRFADLTAHISHLQDRVPSHLDAYLANLDTRLICERLVELIVEAATDVHSELMMREGREPPPSYYDAFIIVGQMGLIPIELARRLAPLAGLRNRLAHEYEAINHERVYRDLQRYMPLLIEYLRHLTDML